VVRLIRFDGEDVLCELCGELVYKRNMDMDFTKLALDAGGMAEAMLAHLPMHQPVEIEMYLETLRAQAKIKAEG
jgi:hypothetical protein